VSDDAAALAARLAERADALARLLAAPGVERALVDASFSALTTTVGDLGAALRSVVPDGPQALAIGDVVDVLPY